MYCLYGNQFKQKHEEKEKSETGNVWTGIFGMKKITVWTGIYKIKRLLGKYFYHESIAILRETINVSILLIYPATANKFTGIIIFIQAADLYSFAGGRMYKMMVGKINTNMRNTAACIKKYKIPGQ